MRRLASWLRRLSRPTRSVRTGPPNASRPPFVEALEGRLLPTAYVVTTTKDILGNTTPGEVTLRDALAALDGIPSGNATAVGTATNSITFAIPGTGPQEIDVGSDPSALKQPLPAIARQVLLDGWSQGGSGYQGPPLIVLNGANAGSDASGMVLNAGSDGSTIRGLVIQGYSGDGIDVNGSSGNVIAGNYIGTDVGGMAPVANAGQGVLFYGGATGNTVGGTTRAEANVVSGNGASGVVIYGAGTSGNVVLGNLLGTNVLGTASLHNRGDESGAGVLIADAPGNTVGGTAPGSANVISGYGSGVQLFGAGTSGNMVLGNLIGTDITGTTTTTIDSFGRPSGNIDGVLIASGASGNTVGGTTAAAANVISASSSYGVQLVGADTRDNVLLGNLIGTNRTGTVALSNYLDGVNLFGCGSGNVVGGTAPGSANVISGNHQNGVGIYGSSGNVVLGNLIGTDRSGTALIGNGYTGIYPTNGGNNAGVYIASGSTANTVGGTAAGAANTICGNVSGVTISDTTTHGNVVEGNYVGTNASGTVGLGNLIGIGLAWSAENTVGGTVTGSANVVSGNGELGVGIGDIGATGNVVLGNLIGTDPTGTAKLGNGGDGVGLGDGATSNTIGGTAPGAANVISGNASNGVEIAGTSGNAVIGNLIGTDKTGTAPLGNSLDGVFIHFASTANTVGGSAPGAGNVISGNGTNGVEINGTFDGSSLNLVLGNLIGTDKTGTAALGNSLNGVFIHAGATANTVGGAAAGAGNVISGNGQEGVEINGSNRNFVLGNLIGTNISGTAGLGNNERGVWLDNGATANVVGGAVPGAGNVISGNGTGGVEINHSTGNAVQGNLIGTDRDGTAPLGNGAGGDGVAVLAGSVRNSVGGSARGAGNVISGDYMGVYISGAGTNRNAVLGNLIGTDKTGTVPLGNFTGVAVGGGAAANSVGGLTPGAANVISGNSYGVDIRDTGTSGNVARGNSIGTDRSGKAKLGNTVDGVLLEEGATRNLIGGGNAIAFNAKGVVLTDSATLGDSILGNRIWGNTGPGIDINDDGPTFNGTNPRALPNNGQNTPVITGLTRHSVSGRLKSVPRTWYRIEFFATPAGGPANQGQIYLGFLNVLTSAAGVVTFTAPVATIPLHSVVTTTATNLGTGDTSEFSPVGTQLLLLSNPVVYYSAAPQAVTLSAQVFFGTAPVTSGAVIFRIAGIGVTVIGRLNANGVASVTFFVPAGTWPGAYAITASLFGTEGVPPAVGYGLLTIAPLPPVSGGRME